MRPEGNARKSGEPIVKFLLHCNAPAHRSVFIKVVLTKNNAKTLELLQYYPDPAPADFYLFCPLKSA